MAANIKTLTKTLSETDIYQGMRVPKDWVAELPYCEPGKRIELEIEDGVVAGKRWKFTYSVHAFIRSRGQRVEIRANFLKLGSDEFFQDKKVVAGDEIVLQVVTDPNNGIRYYRIKAQRRSHDGVLVTL